MKGTGEKGDGLPPAELQPPQADSRAQRDAQVPVLRGLAEEWTGPGGSGDTERQRGALPQTGRARADAAALLRVA